MTQRYLIAADDKKEPGKVVCTFITFQKEVIDAEAYDSKRSDFVVLAPDLPEASALRRLVSAS